MFDTRGFETVLIYEKNLPEDVRKKVKVTHFHRHQNGGPHAEAPHADRKLILATEKELLLREFWGRQEFRNFRKSRVVC